MAGSAEQSNGVQVTRWSQQLGLAASSLFGSQESLARDTHFALLDGRRGSFALSIISSEDVSAAESKNWQWSADLAHHVFLTTNQVILRSGNSAALRCFERSSVEDNLEDFHSFLDKSARKVLPDIVPFLVDEFLQVWATFKSPSDEKLNALAAFVLELQAAGEPDSSVIEDVRWRRKQAKSLGLEQNLVDEFSYDVVQRALQLKSRTPLGLQLIPRLVLRHAAGRLFQETHAHLEAQPGLFGDAAISTVPTVSPTGAYFTPVPIARLLVESVLSAWPTLPEDLTIADFACGSAVFLCEALRELERRGHEGSVSIVGRDISAEAIAMAKVAIATTVNSLVNLRVHVDVLQVDIMALRKWPKADIVLMNPPFRAWQNMTAVEREWVRDAMGDNYAGRPDLSVGFIEHSLRALKRSGVFATLVPAGLLASEGLNSWRESLLERSHLRLVAVLGEHGLFRHAFVNVGLLVVTDLHSGDVYAPLSVAWASPEAGAASEAIRALRKLVYVPRSHLQKAANVHARAWTVTQTSPEVWNQRVSWLPGPSVLGSLLDSLNSNVKTQVSNLFNVHQGIRTGAKGVFVVSREKLNNLPQNEKRYFKAVVDTPSFENGKIVSKNYLFISNPEWKTEANLAQEIPTFYNYVLKPAKEQLTGRQGIKPERWWELTRVRRWSFQNEPRLISKRFGLCPAFALDLEGKLAVLQANAWVPNKASLSLDPGELEGILRAYWWLLNSRVMVALFREYCPNVAGGQLDLEKKYVKHVPLPNLAMRMLEDSALNSLASELLLNFPCDLPPVIELDRFTALAYYTTLEDWPLR